MAKISILEVHIQLLESWMSQSPYFGNKFTVGDYIHDSCGRPKLTLIAGIFLLADIHLRIWKLGNHWSC